MKYLSSVMHMYSNYYKKQILLKIYLLYFLSLSLCMRGIIRLQFNSICIKVFLIISLKNTRNT